jgi:hypothetical protein
MGKSHGPRRHGPYWSPTRDMSVPITRMQPLGPKPDVGRNEDEPRGGKTGFVYPVLLALRRLRSGDSRVSQSHPNFENSQSEPGKDTSRKLSSSNVSASRMAPV